MSQLRAKLQLLKDAEQHKQEIDKDLLRDFIEKWYATIEVIRAAFEESAVAVFGDQGLKLTEVAGKRDIALEWERGRGAANKRRYELRYQPNFEACNVALKMSTPRGSRSEPVTVERITTATVEASVETFVREVMAEVPGGSREGYS